MDEDTENALEMITSFVGTLQNDADANDTFLGLSYKFTLQSQCNYNLRSLESRCSSRKLPVETSSGAADCPHD